MESFKQFVEAPRTAPPDLVGINLTTAGHLARALEEAAEDLRLAARQLLVAANASGVVSTAVVEVAAMAGWADGEARRLRAVVTRLGSTSGGPVARWTGGGAAGFADPVAAHRLAHRVAEALGSGDLAVAASLLGRHADDPVVATVLLEALGPREVASLLGVAHRTWAESGPVADARREVVASLGRALAVAGRQGTARFDLGDLARSVERASVAPAALALLFTGGARFGSAALRQAMATVVVPVNAALRSSPGVGPDPWLIPARGRPLDARVVILEAVAADRRAAVAAVAAVDLDLLLDPDLAYLDGGVALAGVLLAATTPVDAEGRVVRDPLTTASAVEPGVPGDNARRVVEWIGRHGRSPLAVQVELGRLVRPWIGSLRAEGLGRASRRHLDVDVDAALAFLRHAHAREAPSAALDRAAWDWAEAELDHLARTPGAAGVDAVGSVVGLVTLARLDAGADRAARGDSAADRQGWLWRRAAAVAVARAPAALRPVADRLVRRGLDRALPDTDGELRHWRDQRDPAVLHEHLALEHLVAATLWSRPDHGGLPHPPAVLLIDPARPEVGLALPRDLDAAGVEAWTRWRSAAAAGGPAPLQVAGERFLLDTRHRDGR